MLKFVNGELKNPIVFKDEPHFQREILHRDIPIFYKNTEYFPLVSEFPSSPGIDLIYFSTSGKLVLAELKHKTKNYDLAQKETIHHYEKNKNSQQPHCQFCNGLRWQRRNCRHHKQNY